MTADAGSLAAAARLTVGVVLVSSGVAKLVSRQGSESQLARFGVPGALSSVASVGVPLLELAVAVLVLAVPGRWPTWLAVGAFALFTGFVAAELQRGEREPCRCFGSLSNRPMSTRALARNAWLLALAVIATGASSSFNDAGWLVAPLVAVSAVVILTT